MWQILSLVVVAGLAGHQPLAAQTIEAELVSSFAAVAEDLRASAEKMPADRYGFRPVEGVRSFGQLIAHVAGGHYLYCSQAAGLRLDAIVARRLNEVRPFSDVATALNARSYAKQELVELLADSIAYCRSAYEKLDAGVSTQGLRSKILNIAHSNEHYGNVVTYLRINGIVPSSTERRASRK